MKAYRVVVGRRADTHIHAIDTWWLRYRRDSPDLFLDELNVALSQLAQAPRTGLPYPTARPRSLRRLLLPRSRHHVYYTVDERRRQVCIRAVWHAARGGKPRLA